MKLVVFGLSITSSWGNVHAATWRALLRAFAARGHDIAFYERNTPWYAENRDHPEPSYLELRLYDAWDDVAARALAEARDADAVIVGSYVHEGPRVIDALAEAGIDPLFFYDIDTPATVAALRGGGADHLRRDQVPLFARYLSCTGGPFLREVVEGEMDAREAVALYDSVDGDLHHPDEPDRSLACDLAYMGAWAEDRQPVVEQLLLRVARRMPRERFMIVGPQYPAEMAWPANVRHLVHLEPARHPRFHSSAAWQLHVTRAGMMAAGWSPTVRLFEAAACGAAILADRWPGLDRFFTPGREILLPETTEEVVEILESTHPDDRIAIGLAARARVLAEHTAAHRAEQLEACLAAGDRVLSA